MNERHHRLLRKYTALLDYFREPSSSIISIGGADARLFFDMLHEIHEDEKKILRKRIHGSAPTAIKEVKP